MIKPSQPPWRAGEKRHPLWWLRHHLYPKGSMSLDFRVALLPYIHCCHRLTGFSGRFRSLTNPVRWCNSSSFATPLSSVGRQKESALMGRLGALLRPTCTSYAGCAQCPYGCSALCHMTLRESVERFYSPPLNSNAT